MMEHYTITRQQMQTILDGLSDTPARWSRGLLNFLEIIIHEHTYPKEEPAVEDAKDNKDK